MTLHVHYGKSKKQKKKRLGRRTRVKRDGGAASDGVTDQGCNYRSIIPSKLKYRGQKSMAADFRRAGLTKLSCPTM
jgi:hypothetical protein